MGLPDPDELMRDKNEYDYDSDSEFDYEFKGLKLPFNVRPGPGKKINAVMTSKFVHAIKKYCVNCLEFKYSYYCPFDID